MISAIYNWILWVTGTSTTDGTVTWWYNLWSGFGDPRWLLIGGIVYWHHMCHTRKCYRLARVQTAAGDKVCRTHHPDLISKPNAEQIKAAHVAASS